VIPQWYNKRETSLDGWAHMNNDNLSNELDRITGLGKARADEYTERLSAFVEDMELSSPKPFIPLLAELALTRVLILRLVKRYGAKRGLIEAREAFDSTFDQMKPILEDMEEAKGPFPL
jgi:hypothetical protein